MIQLFATYLVPSVRVMISDIFEKVEPSILIQKAFQDFLFFILRAIALSLTQRAYSMSYRQKLLLPLCGLALPLPKVRERPQGKRRQTCLAGLLTRFPVDL